MKALRSISMLIISLALGSVSACTSVDKQSIAERDRARTAEIERLHAIQNNL